ncbi:hypothetical protein J6590_036751 [Homalodisca vitripennis]|nr:hypothetical protein J6590_036751 [Homalodisca vitripennis]
MSADRSTATDYRQTAGDTTGAAWCRLECLPPLSVHILCSAPPVGVVGLTKKEELEDQISSFQRPRQYRSNFGNLSASNKIDTNPTMDAKLEESQLSSFVSLIK